MGKTIVYWALCLALTASAVAQHQHTLNAETIDGSKNPELVPDLTAYRMYFLAASSPENATAEESAKHWNHIRALGTSFDDSQAIGRALAEFRSKYDAMVKDFNGTVGANTGPSARPDYAQLIQRRDALVQSTIDKINAALSADGASRLAENIQKQKTRIRITRPKSQ